MAKLEQEASKGDEIHKKPKTKQPRKPQPTNQTSSQVTLKAIAFQNQVLSSDLLRDGAYY